MKELSHINKPVGAIRVKHNEEAQNNVEVQSSPNL